MLLHSACLSAGPAIVLNGGTGEVSRREGRRYNVARGKSAALSPCCPPFDPPPSIFTNRGGGQKREAETDSFDCSAAIIGTN
ncbi:hypothetical protein ZWY2020_058546 [Hordeum vulgare]|nr:hypothetical protein ZWY2020_058546 [Hordeum vulgare]